jgi:hypothetical protein
VLLNAVPDSPTRGGTAVRSSYQTAIFRASLRSPASLHGRLRRRCVAAGGTLAEQISSHDNKVLRRSWVIVGRWEVDSTVFHTGGSTEQRTEPRQAPHSPHSAHHVDGRHGAGVPGWRPPFRATSTDATRAADNESGVNPHHQLLQHTGERYNPMPSPTPPSVPPGDVPGRHGGGPGVPCNPGATFTATPLDCRH